MKLHWSPKSPFVRKVMIAAHELGLTDQLTLVRTVAAMKAPNPVLLQDNPLNKIPTLVLADGQVLFDSLTICEYLDSLAGHRLFPASGADRWRVMTWHALANGLLDVLILLRNERDKPAQRQTPEWLSAFELKLQLGLNKLEAETASFAALPFGIAHITIGCCVSYMDFRFADLNWRQDRPALTAWHRTFSARPSVVATEITDG